MLSSRLTLLIYQSLCDFQGFEDRVRRMEIAILNPPFSILDSLPRRALLPIGVSFFAAYLDVNLFRFEWLTSQPVCEPVDEQCSSTGITDRVLFSFINHQHARTRDRVHELMNELDGTKVVVFASDDEIRTADLGSHVLKGQRLGELIESRFVIIAGHVHIIELEGRRGRIEDRILARFNINPAHRAGLEAGFDCGDTWAPIRAHAGAHDGESVGIDFRALHQKIAGELSRIFVVGGRAFDTTIPGFALARPVDGKNSDAPL